VESSTGGREGALPHANCKETSQLGRPPTAAKVWQLHQRVQKEHLPTQTLNKKGLQLQQMGRAIYWRKQKGHASRRTLNK
jgi:hypothetical protein